MKISTKVRYMAMHQLGAKHKRMQDAAAPLVRRCYITGQGKQVKDFMSYSGAQD
jgi:hypothetical protein